MKRSTPTVPVLWHFRFSHFNEKVRWALDWKRIPHRRRALLPGFHRLPIWWMTGQKYVPVLVLEGVPIADSTQIIAALELYRPMPPLYPSNPRDRARALALEEFFDEELGPHLRRAVFHSLFEDVSYTTEMFATGFAKPTRVIYRCVFPLFRAIIRREMQITAETAARSRAKLTAAVDRLEAEIGVDGYLVGDRFSVADLTAAALLGPLVAPEFFCLPPFPRFAESMRDWLRARPAFNWVDEIYRRHRGRSAEISPKSPTPCASPATLAPTQEEREGV